jgi:hypothetical protein
MGPTQHDSDIFGYKCELWTWRFTFFLRKWTLYFWILNTSTWVECLIIAGSWYTIFRLFPYLQSVVFPTSWFDIKVTGNREICVTHVCWKPNWTLTWITNGKTNLAKSNLFSDRKSTFRSYQISRKSYKLFTQVCIVFNSLFEKLFSPMAHLLHHSLETPST